MGRPEGVFAESRDIVDGHAGELEAAACHTEEVDVEIVRVLGGGVGARAADEGGEASVGDFGAGDYEVVLAGGSWAGGRGR